MNNYQGKKKTGSTKKKDTLYAKTQRRKGKMAGRALS